MVDISTRLSWPVYLLLALFCAWLVWILVAPDYWWRVERAFVGWKYRDGHRIELSTAGRAATRMATVAAIAVLCALAVVSVHWTAASRVRTERQLPAGTVYDVGDPVEAPGCVVRVFACLRAEEVFPIAVEEYRAYGGTPGDRPARGRELPDGTNLLLYMEPGFFPTHLVLDEGGGDGERVTVTVYGRCARAGSGEAYGRSRADCATDPQAVLDDRGIVPVSLAEPLGARALVDGDRDAPVAPVE